jgi:predicted transcriptional regulator
MSLEQRAQILKAATMAPSGVRDITGLLKLKTSNTIALLHTMVDEQLIEVQTAKIAKKGRPKKCIRITPLGNDFLEAYQKTEIKLLKSRKQDLNRAEKDALYAMRLVANGHSPFEVFLELNMIAGNIKSSSTSH